MPINNLFRIITELPTFGFLKLINYEAYYYYHYLIFACLSSDDFIKALFLTVS